MILSGEVYKFETASQFKSELRVTWDEIIPVFSDTQQDEICSYENEHRESTDDELISDPGNAHEDLLAEFFDELNPFTVITTVLENRDREYIHLYDGYIHTVVELSQIQSQRTQSC